MNSKNHKCVEGGRVQKQVQTSIESLENLWPLFQTRPAAGRVYKQNPIWEESFTAKSAYSAKSARPVAHTPGKLISFQDDAFLLTCAIEKQEVGIIATLHHKNAVDEDSWVGKAVYTNLKPGDSLELSLPLENMDGSLVYGVDGTSSTLHVEYRYLDSSDYEGKAGQLQHSSDELNNSLRPPEKKNVTTQKSSCWNSDDMQCSQEVNKIFYEDPTGNFEAQMRPSCAENLDTNERGKSKMNTPEPWSGFSLETMLIHRLLRQRNTKGPGNRVNDACIPFSPNVLGAVILLLINACTCETQLKLWQVHFCVCSVSE
jgi:hypothetical protein